MKLSKLLFNIIFAIIGWASSVISIYQLNIFGSTSRILILCAAIILTAFFIWSQISCYMNECKIIFEHSNKAQVNKYLYNWLNMGDRTVIFTRDLTWADESDEIRNVLEKKAKKNELTICLYKSTETTKRLENLGASIYLHNLPENQLTSRFTIIDYGRNNPKITVGYRRSDGKFVNERYSMERTPNACRAFIEMFELVKSHNIGCT